MAINKIIVIVIGDFLEDQIQPTQITQHSVIPEQPYWNKIALQPAHSVVQSMHKKFVNLRIDYNTEARWTISVLKGHNITNFAL